MDSSLAIILANAGVAGVVVILMITGWLVPKPFYAKLEQENRDLKEALKLEKQRGTDADQAGRVTNQLIGALQNLAEEKGRGRREGPGLTWEDLK